MNNCWGQMWCDLPKDKQKVLKKFLVEVGNGVYGRNKREILRAAKRMFGTDIDWSKIFGILMEYLPVLLSLLK